MTALTVIEQELFDLGINSPKEIDVEAIAWLKGAAVKYRQLDTCAARIVGGETRAIITVQRDDPPERRRFSIGHELGHWQWHKGEVLYCDSKSIESHKLTGGVERERLADRFSAQLLMPRFLMEPRLLAEPNFTWSTTYSLSREFRTSLRATAIRIVELGVQSCMLACYQEDRRCWFVAGPNFPDHLIPPVRLPPGSAASDFANGNRGRNQLVRTPAQVWFNHVSTTSSVIREQVVDAGNGQFLVNLLIEDPQLLKAPRW